MTEQPNNATFGETVRMLWPAFALAIVVGAALNAAAYFLPSPSSSKTPEDPASEAQP